MTGERPLALADATEVLLEYAAAIDERDWDRLHHCFTPDCTVRYDDRRLTGSTAVAEFMGRVHRRIQSTLHRITNVRLDPSAPTATTAYVDAILIRRHPAADSVLRVAGVYHDTWAPFGDEWRIAQRHYRTIWREGSLDPAASRGQDGRGF